MQAINILCLLIFLVVFFKSSWSQATNLTQNSTNNLPNISELCAASCLCGVLNHPLHVLVSPQTIFHRYPQRKSLEKENWDHIYSRIVDAATSVSLRYPISLIFCQHQNQIKNLEDIAFPPQEPGTEPFYFRLSFFSFRQGNLQEISRKFFQLLGSTLRYLDLSYNSLYRLHVDVFSGLTQIQYIDLRHNNIQEVRSFSGELLAWPRPVMRLLGNPLQCSCDLAKFVLQFVAIANDDFSFCTGKGSEVIEIRLRDRSNVVRELGELCRDDNDPSHDGYSKLVSKQKIFHESFPEFHLYGEVPKQKHARLKMEEQHRLTDKLSNTSFPHGDAKDANEHHHHHGKKRQIDIPLLLTMAAWFIMMYFGIKKFIRANALNSRSYNNYLQGRPQKL